MGDNVMGKGEHNLEESQVEASRRLGICIFSYD
jgi:hypothetical protein